MDAAIQKQLQRLEAELARCKARIAKLEAAPTRQQQRLADLPADAEVGQSTLADHLGCSKRTLRRMVRRGELPKPVKWGARRIWTAGTIRAWLAALESRANREDAALRVLLDREMN